MDKSIQATLFGQIHHCANLIHRSLFMQKQGGGHGVSLPRGQGRLLAILLGQDGLAQKELVELLDIRPSSVGELVDKLEAQGLVKRAYDEADRRVVRVFLTDEGRAKATQVAGTRQAMFDDLFGGLTDGEQQQLSGLLEKLNASLKKRVGEAPAEGGPPFGPHGHGGHHGHGGQGGPFGPGFHGCGGRHHGGHQHGCGAHGHPGGPWGRGFESSCDGKPQAPEFSY